MGKKIIAACLLLLAAAVRPAHGETPVKIGILTDLSGAGAYIGNQTRIGAALAADELRAEGRKIDLVFGDHAFSPVKAVSEIQKMIAVDKVGAVFSNFSATSRAAAPAALQHRILFVYTAGATSILSSNPYAFKSYLDFFAGCRMVADFWKKEGIAKTALLKPESEFGEMCAEGLHAVEPSAPVESYRLGEDVRAQMLKFKNQGVGGILNPSFEGDIRNMLAAARDLQYSVRAGVSEDGITAALAGEFGPRLEGTTSFGMPRPPERFLKALDARDPGHTLSAVEFAALACLHVRQLWQAVSACPAGDAECQVKTLLQSPPEPEFTFTGWSSGRIAQFDTVLRVWKNGRIETVSDAASAPDQAKTVKLGFIAPLSGPFADWGQSIRRGLELALEDSQTRFAVDYQDDGCNPAQAVSIAQKFFSVEKIRYVFGPGCDDCLTAIAPPAERAGAILFSTGLLGEDVFTRHKAVINLATQVSSEAKRLGRQIAADGVKRLAIVHGTNTFGEEYGRRLAEALKERGIETFDEGTPLGTVDFRSLLVRLLEKKPDAVFIHQGEQEIIAFAKQLRALNGGIPLYSQYGFETESIRDAGPALSGVVYTYPLNSSAASSEKAAFDRRFAERFGANAMPSATSYYVYDGLLQLDRAVRRCGAEDAPCVLKFFKSIGACEGISGRMRFREDGGLDREYGIKRLMNGSFEWVSEQP